MSDEKFDTEKPKDRRRSTQNAWAVRGYLLTFPNRPFTPPTDIIEMEDRVVILVEVAGMQSDSFKIALYPQHIEISGHRERPNYPEAAYHQAEIGFGDFRLDLPMPWTIERDDISASYEKGFLRVELPRQVARRVHIVDVHETD